MDEQTRQALFRPRSIAVVGASPDQSSYGGRCLRYLRTLGFRGEVFAVNPRYEQIDALVCYPDVDALPSVLDQVVILVGADRAVSSLRSAAARGVRAAVVCSSGFAESDEAGVARQAEIVGIAGETGMAVLGPNSLGYVNLSQGVTSTFTTALDHLSKLPDAGRVALVSQSGALAAILFSVGQAAGLPIGQFISTGNEATVSFADCVDALAHDPEVDTIVGYVEGIRDGGKLLEACRNATDRGTRVVLLHVGRSDAGKRAAQSHTGAIVASHDVATTALERAGVMVVPDVLTLLDVALAPTRPRPPGRGLGIVSGSGGVGVMMADVAVEAGLAVAELGDSTLARLRDTLPAFAPVGNPTDYGPVYQDVAAVETCLRAVAEDPAVDVIVAGLALTPRPWLGGVIEDRLIAVQRSTAKPLVVSWLGVPDSSLRLLRENGVAVYDDPTRAVVVAAHIAGPARSQTTAPRPSDASEPAATAERSQQTRLEILAARDGGRVVLSEREVKTMLARYGVPVSRELLATDAAEASRAAEQFGVPVAVKAEGEGLVHKTDIGAVRLGVEAADAAAAYDEVTKAAAAAGAIVKGALIQEMARPGLEILAGVHVDASFGATLTVGMGGTFTEVFRDTVSELLPVDRTLALDMISRLRSAAIFDAVRGQPPRDRDALAAALEGLSAFACDAGSLLSELDLNPITVYAQGDGCVVLDAVLVLDNAGGS